MPLQWLINIPPKFCNGAALPAPDRRPLVRRVFRRALPGGENRSGPKTLKPGGIISALGYVPYFFYFPKGFPKKRRGV